MMKSRSANEAQTKASENEDTTFAPERSVRHRTSMFMRRGSSGHTLKTSQYETSQISDAAVKAARNFTSPAASGRVDIDDGSNPIVPTIALQQRRRRGSSFFGIPSFLKGKGKETIPPLPTMPVQSAVLLGPTTILVDSPTTTVTDSKRLEPPSDEVFLAPATPPPDKGSRRFSFLPPFFRSVSASAQLQEQQCAGEAGPPASDDSEADQAVRSLLPLPIPIPRLPHIAPYDDDLSASVSLVLDSGTRHKTRSRASTRDALGITTGVQSAAESEVQAGHSRRRSLSISPSGTRRRLDTTMSAFAPNSPPGKSPAHNVMAAPTYDAVPAEASDTITYVEKTINASLPTAQAIHQSASLLPPAINETFADSTPPSPTVRFAADASGRDRSDSSSSDRILAKLPTDGVHPLTDGSASGNKAVTLLRLRRRANTAGSVFSESSCVTPADSTTDVTSPARSIRSASSSRLSSMFGSVSSFRTALGSPVSLKDVDHTLRASPSTPSSETMPTDASQDKWRTSTSSESTAQSPTFLSPLSALIPSNPFNSTKSARSVDALSASPDTDGPVQPSTDFLRSLQAVDGEEPQAYLTRLTAAMPFSELGSVLATKSALVHTFHSSS